MGPAETTGRFAKTEVDEGGGAKSVAIDKARHFGPLEAGVWKEMCEMAVFTAKK